MDKLNKKRRKTIKKNNKRIKKTIWVVLLSCLGLLALVFTMTSSYFVIDDIYIIGTNYIREEKVKDLIKDHNMNYWFLKERDIKETLSLNHLIDDVITVEKSFPNDIYIEVDEKRPEALLIYEGEHYLVSSDSTILEEVSNLSQGLPFVTGTEGLFSEIKVGNSLESQLSSSVESIFKSIAKYELNNISEIKLTEDKFRLYLDNGFLVKLGTYSDIEQKFDTLKNVQHKLYNLSDNYYLDLRVPSNPVLVENGKDS
ncbi:cell division protein FtsQ/DivIB [Natranaerobius trueperi]|uniref:Uncharacterized protein n=1 Tax=Natranaerobius trueperi TaxID=759412 RepID=A0A226C0L4_9FIRM|nr:cell division protein FtsQ/DivIB [Natranaerobius trueperi]OWZ84134.1 hypothetical protein CDO51_04500 [Natranaerobius trueperi]